MVILKNLDTLLKNKLLLSIEKLKAKYNFFKTQHLKVYKSGYPNIYYFKK